MGSPRVRRPALVGLPSLLLASLLAACGTPSAPSAPSTTAPASAETGTTSATGTTSPSPTRTSPPPTRTGPPPRVEHVVAVSVDGLNPTALTELGPAELPTFWRLIHDGASTFDARTEVERTDTLPNHTGMLTGRRVDADHGGHGVFFNDSVEGTIEDQTGVRSASVFDVVADAGLTSSLFASKYKFEVFERSWPAITQFHADPDNEQMTKEAVADLTEHDRAFAFLHLSAPDVAGHAHTWLSPQYLDAVKETDANLGRIVDAIEGDDDLADDTVLLVTADHGGNPHVGLHTVPDDPDNYTIPFLAWGAGVPQGVDLYDLNARRHDPGDSRPGYGPGGPIRNGDVANAALDLLGLSTVPGSEFGLEDPVQVR